MRIIILLGLICIVFSCSSEPSQMEKLNWLLGEWSHISNTEDEKTFEVWQKAADGSFEGLGCTIKNGDTTFVEHLKIELKEGSLYYVADVSHNEHPIYFKFVEHRHHFFLSTNPEHDFPQTISYNQNQDSLEVHISGENGKKVAFNFIKEK